MLKSFSRIFCVSVLLWSVVSTGWALQRVETQNFVLPVGGKLIVDTYRGAIDIKAGEGREVAISMSMFSGKKDKSEASEALDRVKFDFTQEGSHVVLKARNPFETGVKFVWEDETNIDIRITVTVPEDCDLDLRTRDGGITVGNIRGEMKATTEVGSIFFRSIDGDILAKAQSGNVVVSRCTGSVDLRTGQGDVRIGTVGGRARLETVNGDIEVQTAHDVVEANVADGNIEAGFAVITGKSKIRTKFGDIVARINPAEACTISARARWGRVDDRLSIHAINGGNGRSRLSGDYNGGGPLIDLRASGGTVRIDSGKPYFEM